METKWKIHVGYILAILVAIIIVLITVEWSEIPQLVNYFSFALTFSSICLAIVAIVFSLYSNTAFSNNITSLDKTVSDINKTSEKLSLSTEKLYGEIKAIPKEIENFGSKLDETNKTLLNLKKQPIEEPRKVEHAEKNVLTEDEAVNNFYSTSSILSLLAINICYIAYKKGAGFVIKKINSELLQDSETYIEGFLVALDMLGIINHTKVDNIYTINSINEKFVSPINERLKERLEEVKKEESESDEKEFSMYDWIVDSVKGIDKYFK